MNENEEKVKESMRMFDPLTKATKVKRSYSDDTKQLWESKSNNKPKIKELKEKYPKLQGTY